MAIGGSIGNLLFKVTADSAAYKRGMEDVKRAGDATMKSVAESTKKATEEQAKLEASVKGVTGALESSAASATSWGSRAGKAFAEGFGKFEEGSKSLGQAAKGVGEVFEKAGRLAKELGLEMDPMVSKIGSTTKAFGELALELGNVATTIRAIGVNAAALGLGVGGAALGAYMMAKGGYDIIQTFRNDAETWAAGERSRMSGKFNDDEDAQWTEALAAKRRAYVLGLATANQVGGLQIDTLDVRGARNERRGGGGGKKSDPIYFVETGTGPMPVFSFQTTLGNTAGTDRAGSAMGISAPGRVTGAQAAANMGGEGLGEQWTRFANEFAAESKRSILKDIFGPTTEVALYTESLTTLRDVVDVLGGSLQGMYDSWASGEKSLGEAMKDGAKGALKGIGSLMAGKAVGEIAEAAGEVAKGFSAAANPFTAATAPAHFAAAAAHGKAALVYGGAAAVLGVASRAVAGGGAGAGAGYAGGAGAGGGGPGVPVTGPTNIVIVHDSTGRKSERTRARETQEDIDMAMRYRETSGTVVRG